MFNGVATHSRLKSGICLWSLTMMSRRVLSALEPMIVLGLVVSLALVGHHSLGTVISSNVQPLSSLALVPEEPTRVALANEESLPTTNR